MKHTIKYILCALLVIGVIIFVYHTGTEYHRSEVVSPSPARSNKTYTSDFLKATISYPDTLMLVDKGSSLELTNQNGTIRIETNATNYPRLDGYIAGLEKRNRLEIIKKSKGNHPQYDSEFITVKTPHSATPYQYSYYIYPGNWTVYELTTTAQSLQSDMASMAEHLTVNMILSPTPTIMPTYTYTSKKLSFSLDLIDGYTVLSEEPVVKIGSDKGGFTITKEPTDFSSLQDYLQNLDQKNTIMVTPPTDFYINDYVIASRTIPNSSSPMKKTFYVYGNKNIYILSSSDPSVFSDLDEMIFSFRL